MVINSFFKSLNKYYWSQVNPSARFNGIWTNKVDSLLQFVRDYAFQRRGGTEYADIAVEAVEKNRTLLKTNVGWNKKIQEIVKRDFSALCGHYEVRENPRLDIFELGEKCILKIFSPEMIGRKPMPVWIGELMKQPNGTKIVFDHIRRIRGIGEKIAAFYLRDISLKNGSEVSLEFKEWLQPIDIWTARAADLLPELKCEEKIIERKRVSLRHIRANKLIVFERKYKLRTGEANIGFWVLGAKIVRDEKKFKDVVKELVKGVRFNRLAQALNRDLLLTEKQIELLTSLIQCVRHN